MFIPPPFLRFIRFGINYHRALYYISEGPHFQTSATARLLRRYDGSIFDYMTWSNLVTSLLYSLHL
ncbi:hypothetical protein BCR43DRAFT_481788 [Syncephalastrum racemosum]|uniref:Uncharacterized protein n=1 Tax=Syncephalastrum racemosum TaxID=13706 RepID=A0A1X2HSN5_SYNRA|nr:hypothetical protein BCR43DRAFT_481788 [Syncephalastrum racemosum]